MTIFYTRACVTRRFLLCAEDVLAASLARDLCDRVVRERACAEWLRALWSGDLCATQRVWTGLRPDTSWADRGSVEREAAARGIRSHVRVRETGRLRAAHGHAGESFRAVRVAAVLDPRPDLVIIAGDTDGDEDPDGTRDAGLALAGEVGIAAVVASLHREAEAWVVAGFVPQNAAEMRRLRAVERSLGFNPTEAPERLMSDLTGDLRDAKRVARELLDDDVTPRAPRVCACWLDTPLDVLLRRAARAGLADYVRALERVLLPMLGDAPDDDRRRSVG